MGRYCRRLFAAPLALLVLTVVIAAPADAYLYFGQGNGSGCPIGRANLSGTGVEHDFIIQGTCGSPAVDATHIYWVFIGASHFDIARANIDGSGVNRTFIALRGEASSVAVDAAHIYWSDSTGIGRANLNGSGVDPTFVKLAGGAQQIAIDAGHIYWSNGTGIGRANLDGTHLDPAFIAAAAAVNGIALDRAHIYWANFGGLGAGRPPGTIGRANLDGSGVEPQFITGPQLPSGVAVDATHVYWGNYGSGTIGRANLDGTAPNENFIRNAGASGLAVDALTQSSVQPPGGAMLHGPVTLLALGGKTHGYIEGAGGSFGTADGAFVDLTLDKSLAFFSESNVWSTRVTSDNYALDPREAWLEVIAPLGSYGQIDFTFTGKPHRQNLSCGQTRDVAQGTLRGLIRFNTRERFFKTVTVRRMSATLMDTPTPATAMCHPPPCAQPDYSMSANGPFRTGIPTFGVSSIALARGNLSGEVFSVGEPTFGTPFSSIEHSISIVRRHPYFTTSPSLSGGTLTTPGGLITGALSLRGSTNLVNSRLVTCKGHRYRGFGRGAKVSGGEIIVRFDSIGPQRFGTQLTTGNMSGYRRVS
jgi:hypothetical protein